MRQQFLEGEPPLRRMPAEFEFRELCFARRPVHETQRFLQGRQSQRLNELRRYPVAHGRCFQLAQGLRDERAKPSLRHAFGQRIDGGERLLQRNRLTEHALVFGVHDLQSERAFADFAKTAHARSAGQSVLLRSREVEEPQGEKARAVGNPAQHLPAAAELHFGELNLTLHRSSHARHELAHLPQARTVLVARRQHEEQVLDLRHSQMAKAFGQRRTNTAQRGDRPLLRVYRLVLGRRLSHDSTWSGISPETKCTRFRRALHGGVARRRRLREPDTAAGNTLP